ncbi:hypothetical protein QTG56_19575 [Rossellomorea sp. AcN35-11]|nr:hypothetical protein [Rossellomorea aquimaris]NMH71454.1 hypothetical protein [Bacillus sp. RO3]WJV29155.1 hypothetical protein QTG56_19575 [Rossellomorea sp. AcN35-11]
MSTRKNDHPEQINQDHDGILDQHESERNVDPIPLDDLKKDLRDEKKKHQTKEESSSKE